MRERPADILPLARHFLALYGPGVRLAACAAQQLLQYRWPGNVRELENAVQRALLVRSGDELTDADFSTCSEAPEATAPVRDTDLSALQQALESLFERGVPNLQARVEAAPLISAYRYCGRNQLETARMLGMSRHVVRARLIEHGELPCAVRRAPSAVRRGRGAHAGTPAYRLSEARPTHARERPRRA